MIGSFIQTIIQWYAKTPERSLDQAYRAALKIKEIEDKYFNGQKVSKEFTNYGDSVVSSFRTEVKGFLQIIKIRKAEYETSRFIGILANLVNIRPRFRDSETQLGEIDHDLLMFEQLKFVDEILAKYRVKEIYVTDNSSLSRVDSASIRNQANFSAKSRALFDFMENSSDYNERKNLSKVTDKSGVLPRSFLNTINKIKQDIDPKSVESEEAVLQRYRFSRYQTGMSIKFLLLIIIVPLLTHQVTKTFLINPIVRQYSQNHEQVIFINKDYEEEAFVELRQFEESLHFKGLIGLTPKLSLEEVETSVKQKAEEISEEYRHRGTDAIANVFADLLSVVAFGIVIVFSRREIEIVKGFLDGIVYNLSDSAKAFLIILFTDMFVGFHSPHGWEIILENTARHFGLSESRDFNFLFIATFPVILDTVLKYWIFRYLNRISPSAVATYRNMNE
ncbi:proton extrusion protein PcxA [Aphanothece hegewaldii CCALA 016]|uniref:Proton extrusion protein PxcA n=1 Tax=Aphanothece hegewaldii CCALA 016 TaxID=2107694 RepID=A0A2T1LWY9_9CHRO|nr:proton extrusion protein PcxA [Aphanothece hegewaldii]PSF36678.1 proton extrusion protein PcxA [Aphanothece hegewaldii CCALA 016]